MRHGADTRGLNESLNPDKSEYPVSLLSPCLVPSTASRHIFHLAKKREHFCLKEWSSRETMSRQTDIGASQCRNNHQTLYRAGHGSTTPLYKEFQ